MQLNTGRFGEIVIEEAKIINFTQAIFGFPKVKRYIILDQLNNPNIPFKWLQAIDMPELAFVVTDPLLFYPGYNPGIEEQDLRELNITDPLDRGIIVIVTIPHGEPEKMTANLQGPVVLNLKTRDAKQVVLFSEEYPFHFPLLADNIKLQSSYVR